MKHYSRKRLYRQYLDLLVNTFEIETGEKAFFTGEVYTYVGRVKCEISINKKFVRWLYNRFN